MSGGQRKAVALARSIIHEPPLLLLDEVTGSMDHASEAAILKNLRRYAVGKTMLVITHHTALLELVDRIIVLDSGKIVADGPGIRSLKRCVKAGSGGRYEWLSTFTAE
ncbi:ATP-binding cassette domain-containing protein [Aliamphritea spongicola]|nr:ATP-binding cassette domain-containing protein [Aliamphritea spongicola]